MPDQRVQRARSPKARRPAALALLAGLALLSASAFGQEPPGPTEVRAERSARLAKTLPKVKGTLELGAEHVAYTAYVKDGAVAFLDERVTGADQKTRDQRYYYDAGRLFFYATDTARGKVVGSGPTATGSSVPVRVEWNDLGQVTRGVRLEHWGEVKLDSRALAAISARAGLLSRLALLRLKATAPAPGTPP